MCMIDFADEPVTMLAKKMQTALKLHKCAECRRLIEPGERYMVERFVTDGTVVRHKTCKHCLVVREWLMAECGGWVFGDVEEDLDEHACDGYPMDVKRLAVSMRRDWRNHHGCMMPVPTRPMTTLERQHLAHNDGVKECR